MYKLAFMDYVGSDKPNLDQNKHKLTGAYHNVNTTGPVYIFIRLCTDLHSSQNQKGTFFLITLTVQMAILRLYHSDKSACIELSHLQSMFIGLSV